MANIKVNNLHPVGFGLLQDLESYLQELSLEDRIHEIAGGGTQANPSSIINTKTVLK